MGDDDITWRAYPKPEMLAAAGINRNSGPTGDIVMYLAGLNDEGSDFNWIAEQIEQDL